MNRAVFLDRDGTIIEDVGHLGELNKVKFLPRAGEAIKLLNEKGFKVIIITNQAGVARGYFTEEAVKERLKVYFAQTTPLIDYYAKSGKLLEVDGGGGVDKVSRRVISALQRGSL